MLIVVMAGLCGFAVLAISLSGRGSAAFPGTNGRIAFSNGQSYASQSIYSINADGTSPTGLTSSTNDYWPSYSANGSRIAFNRQNSIVVMNSDGSGPVQIANGTKSEAATSKWETNYKDPGTEKIIPVVKIETRTRTAHGFFNPAFTPDGTQLAVAEDTLNRTQEQVCAVEKSGDTECLDYEETGAYFHYHSQCNECFEHIVMLNAATGAVTAQVTPAANETFDFSPTVSVNGAVAFVRVANGSSAGSGIFVASAPGAAPSQLTSGRGNYGPDFSPNGTQLVFAHGQREFGLIGVGGGPISLITLAPPRPGSYEYVDSPRFSPDGTQIAFYENIYSPPNTEESGIFVMGANGSGPHRITEGYDPSWQPVPIPPPPVSPRAVPLKGKGKVKLDKKGRGTIGKIVCGSSACKLKILSSKLKLGKKQCSTKANVPKALAAGKAASVKVKVAGKCLAALRKAGKGKLTTQIGVTDALGKHVVTLKATLVSTAKHKKKCKQKHGGK